MDLEKAQKLLKQEEARLAQREEQLGAAKAELAAKHDALREVLLAGADGRPDEKALARARDAVGAASVRVQELEIVVDATRKRIPELAQDLQAARLAAANSRFERVMGEKLEAATKADAAIDAAMKAIGRYLDVSREAYAAAVEVGRGHDGLTGFDHVAWTMQWRLADICPHGGFEHVQNMRRKTLVELLNSFLPALPAGLPPAA